MGIFERVESCSSVMKMLSDRMYSKNLNRMIITGGNVGCGRMGNGNYIVVVYIHELYIENNFKQKLLNR